MSLFSTDSTDAARDVPSLFGINSVPEMHRCFHTRRDRSEIFALAIAEFRVLGQFDLITCPRFRKASSSTFNELQSRDDRTIAPQGNPRRNRSSATPKIGCHFFVMNFQRVGDYLAGRTQEIPRARNCRKYSKRAFDSRICTFQLGLKTSQ